MWNKNLKRLEEQPIQQCEEEMLQQQEQELEAAQVHLFLPPKMTQGASNQEISTFFFKWYSMQWQRLDSCPNTKEQWL